MIARVLVAALLVACTPGRDTIDQDGDGVPADVDCNDADARVGGDEVPYDGVDNDCNPDTPDDDLDGDGLDAAEDCDDADPSVGACDTPTTDPDEIEIVGRQLWVGGQPFALRGVAWHPIDRGGRQPVDLDFAGFVNLDSALMSGAGINVVRTYEPITDVDVLDLLFARGIRVINSIYPAHVGTGVVGPRVEAVRGHPAVLMWLIGNEWNLNGFYVGLDHAESVAVVAEVADIVEALDPDTPVATCYGDLPDAATLDQLPQIDVWGLNVYRGISFGSLFDDWSARSSRPMFLAEFGADAWNTLIDGEDQAAQAEATAALVQELDDHSAAADRGPSLGGVIFSWADGWWKVPGGDPDVHDTDGLDPGGGPYPDNIYNEEWWGIVEVDRTPRAAYAVLAEAWASD